MSSRLFYIPGFPRIGRSRELKALVECYFRGAINEKELYGDFYALESRRWAELRDAAVDPVPMGEFSLYDTTLDIAFALGMVPKMLRESGLSSLEQYFALARGYQKNGKDFRALPMKKWFTTNYHYVVPRFLADMHLKDFSDSLLETRRRAEKEGYKGEAHITGPFTLYVLSDCDADLRGQFLEQLKLAYADTLKSLKEAGIEKIHFDESVLADEKSGAFGEEFGALYTSLLELGQRPEIHIHSSFGDLSPLWERIAGLDIDGLGLDLVEGPGNLDLIKQRKPKSRTIYAGLVNGKNVWRSDYQTAGRSWTEVRALLGNAVSLVPASSCSLLFVPYSTAGETALPHALREQLAFADEKLGELGELAELLHLETSDFAASPAVRKNAALMAKREQLSQIDPPGSEYRGWQAEEPEFQRKVERGHRLNLQKTALKLPPLPTTTIGSFPQTPELRRQRAKHRRGELSEKQYEAFLKKMTADAIKKQEETGLDVLVHGEYERTDMVEHFARYFSGFAFTENAWVQSYGVRAVKPPLIFGDIARRGPITVEWISYAQGLTDKPMKAMLTGPITIYNWSFPGEHLSFEKVINELALALRREILELEAAGIRIIQLDEAALRERLPLQPGKLRDSYLKIAVRGFRLATGGVRPETQVHTHMCYSDFGSIYDSIIDMDADVITIEAAKSDLTIIETIKNEAYPAKIGPGVYDIHSPRIPPKEEIEGLLKKMIGILDADQLWVNPDCGLKTRGEKETWASLENMVAAAKSMRKTL